MKARFFGSLLVLAIIAGGILSISGTVQAVTCSGTSSSCTSWYGSYGSYCNAYSNLGSCTDTAGETMFNILQANDAAITRPTEACGGTCSSNFFSTTSPGSLAATPSDTIVVHTDTKIQKAYLYSSQRGNLSGQVLHQETDELYIKAYSGTQFYYTPATGSPKTGAIDNNVGKCTDKNNNLITGKISASIVMKRPAIPGKGDQGLGEYGGKRTDIANDGVTVYMSGAWLRSIAAKWNSKGHGGMTSPYVPVFEGLFYYGGPPGGCTDITINASKIQVVSPGEIYPQLSSRSLSNSASVGQDSPLVQSTMNATSKPYDLLPQSVTWQAYDFTLTNVPTINNSLYYGSNTFYTHDWNPGAGYNVKNLCTSSKLRSFFTSMAGNVVPGFGRCTTPPLEGGSSQDFEYTVNSLDDYTSTGGTNGTSLAMASYPIGTVACRVLVTDNYDESNIGNGSLRFSYPTCFVIGKQPKLQIWGGDLRTGGDVDTSQTVVSSPLPKCYYGSWVEYGALVDGTNSGARFGSGASLAGTPTVCTHALGGAGTNPMTFANADSSGIFSGTSGFGNFGDTSLAQPASIYTMMTNNQLNIPNATDAFKSNLGTLSGGYYKLSSDITISASNIPAGRTVIVDDPGHTVKITGNISYPASVSTVAELPQVVVVAGTIDISDSVTNIDAWLLADTLIDTCGNKTTAQVSLTVCNKPLQMNGPFASKDANFKRTAGSDSANPSDAGSPAEVLNLRADAYLWEYAQASRNVTPTVVQVTQLPPRY